MAKNGFIKNIFGRLGIFKTEAVPSSTSIDKLKKYLPKELRDLYKERKKHGFPKEVHEFKPYLLPFTFSFSTRGGWITPDGKWFLKSTSSDYDLKVRQRLRDSRLYQFDTRLQAYKEGWVRQDWQQFPFNPTFLTKSAPNRKLRFTFDSKALQNYDMVWALEQIAAAYTLVMPEGFLYEIRLVKYDENNEITFERKVYRSFNFFLLGLKTIKIGI